MNASGSVSKLKRPMTKLCLVILSFAKNLNTSTLCFQILHFIQNDNNEESAYRFFSGGRVASTILK